MDPLVFMFHNQYRFIFLAAIVDDCRIANDADLLSNFRNKLLVAFDVSLYGKLTSLMGWSFKRSPDIKGIRYEYALQPSKTYGMKNANVV
ncbi:hypothetical protein BWQ96_09244 [Gracilariopsis chorda]|uniref:Uncharacterized protein n=1 Tax=Gracilariopsis chorda TaxID=448386 RepID=A0A2V3IG34_9FLOR|nr:hypothetical protein BWQ96_09244 [Gracilariopsis chorda]|eukprot:PXF41049.1 hypothetical protein BWQ96_09244 [Gracilariopsis chorda]